MSNYILEGHTPVPCDDILKWAKWFEGGIAVRRVARTDINVSTVISTVFLGIDHSFGDGEPQLFETMVCRGGVYDSQDGDMERYATWDEAEKGHAAMVARVRAEAK